MLNLNDMNDKLGDYSRMPGVVEGIVTGMMYNPDYSNRVVVVPGVVDEVPIPNALVDGVLAPLKDAANVVYKNDVIKLDAEIIKTKECILAVKFVPVKLWNNYLTTLQLENQRRAALRNSGVPVDPFAIPFEEFFFDLLWKKAQSELYSDALFRGIRNDNGSAAIDMFDGFLTHIQNAIDDAKIIETITGEIDNTNVYQSLLALNDAMGEATKNNITHAHLPGKIFDLLVRQYNPILNTQLVMTDIQANQHQQRVNSIRLQGTNTICFREPGMGDTNRVIFTEPDNLFLGYNTDPSKMQVEVQKENLHLKVIIYFRAGTAIAKQKEAFGALTVNDLITEEEEG